MLYKNIWQTIHTALYISFFCFFLKQSDENAHSDMFIDVSITLA